MSLDFYPASMDARAAWHANWAAQIIALAVKYNISAADLLAIAADNAWVQYWVQARHDFDNQSQQLTKYFNDIAGSDPSKGSPDPMNVGMIGTVPAEVKPGIEFRTRTIARQIKGHAKYSQADGELLGIVADDSLADKGTLTAAFTLKTLANFELQVSFRKFGTDALKLQFRHKGGEWLAAGFLMTSPGTVAIPPTVAGTAEQIEMRGVYMVKNDETGNYSPVYAATIAP